MTSTRKLLAACVGVALASQALPPATAQEFEVASIRPHLGPIVRSLVEIVGTRVTASAMDLAGLILYAYDLQSYQVSGGPEWIGSGLIASRGERFHILAKPQGDRPPTIEQSRQMLQKLLADRFHLVFHREIRALPVYALAVLKNGPKLKESAKPGTPRGHIGMGYKFK